MTSARMTPDQLFAHLVDHKDDGAIVVPVFEHLGPVTVKKVDWVVMDDGAADGEPYDYVEFHYTDAAGRLMGMAYAGSSR